MKKIVVVNRQEFNKIMRDNKINESNVESKTKVAFISINGTFDENRDEFYFKQNKENVLILFFDDVLENTKSDSKIFKAFSRQQGEIVFDFLEKMKNRDLLLIHCDAGISRSGAIGQFAAEYYGIDFK